VFALLQATVASVLGGIVFVGAALVLRIPELRSLLAILGGVVRRRSRIG
jgi:hypothetical protein